MKQERCNFADANIVFIVRNEIRKSYSAHVSAASIQYGSAGGGSVGGKTYRFLGYGSDYLDKVVQKLSKFKVSAYIQGQYQYGQEDATLKVGDKNENLDKGF